MKVRRKVAAGGPYDEVALFRHVVLSRVRAREARGESRPEAVEQTAKELHYDAQGTARRVSERTIYRWLAAARLHDDGPTEAPRGRAEHALDAKLVDFLAQQKREDPRASIPELLRRAGLLGFISPDASEPNRVTAYRALRRRGVLVGRRKEYRARDSRRFAYAHRMQMVLCDGKHFVVGPGRLKRVALFYLDDATRYCLHVVVGTSESAMLFLRGFYEMSCRYGLPGAVYLDHGAGFTAGDVIAVMKALDLAFIHGEEGYPEGRGKIEAFNKTAKHDVLRGLVGRPDIASECSALDLRLGHYLEHQYNVRPHESLHGQTPFERFHADQAPLRYPFTEEALREKFVIYEQRRVTKDHVLPVDSQWYETPRGYAGAIVSIQRRLLDQGIYLLHEGTYIQLHLVDLVANAHARRAKAHEDQEERPPSPKSAADLEFERDFRPVVGPDGGFPQRKRK